VLKRAASCGSHVDRLEFVSSFPDVEETHRRVEPVEDSERHADVCDDGPGPEAVEVQLHGVRLGPRLLQRVDRPHGQVGHQQEGDQLASGFAADLPGRGAAPARRVQDEHGLAGGLREGGQRRDQHQRRVLLHGEVAADHRERRVDEHSGLRGDQQDVVQLQVATAVVPQLANLHHKSQISGIIFFLLMNNMNTKNYK